jgi:hypothetical protein
MAQVTNDGVIIDTHDEVVDEMNADFLTEFGSGPVGIDTSPLSYTGRQNPIIARRIVETQQLIGEIVSLISLNNAQGRFLDFIGTMFSEPRNGPQPATIPARLYGTPNFNVGDRRVRYLRNSTIWRSPMGLLIGATGYVDTDLVSDIVGTTLSNGSPIEAFQDGSDQWVIVDSNSNFLFVESTADYSAGTAIEGAESYRIRLGLAGQSSGTGTEPGVRRGITRVAGTGAVVDNNRLLGVNANGVSGKSIEVIVDQGTDAAVAQAVYDTYSDTAGFFGTTTAYAVDRNGNSVEVKFTRATRVDIEWDVTIDTTGAEVELPDNAVSLVQTALSNYTNIALIIGLDVVPEEGEAVVRNALPTGSIPAGNLTVEVGLKGGVLGSTTIPITSRERAYTNAAAQSATLTGTTSQPFNLFATYILQLAVNGGNMQEVIMEVTDFAVISAATAFEVATIINNRMSGLVAGSTNGSLTIRSSTTGSGSSVEVGVGSTPGLLTALGLSFGTEFGSDGDIAVTII